MDEVTPAETPLRNAPGSPATPAPRSRRKWLVGGFTVLFMLCGATYGAYWAFIGRFEESTDDAYVAGNVVPITPRVNGTVIAIRADNTQREKQGQEVVLLDSTDARIALDQSAARLAQAVRQVQRLYQTAAQQEANVSLEQAKLAQSKIDYRRDTNLVSQKFVSAEDFQHRGTQVEIDQAGLDLAEHQLAATRAAVVNTDLADHPARCLRRPAADHDSRPRDGLRGQAQCSDRRARQPRYAADGDHPAGSNMGRCEL